MKIRRRSVCDNCRKRKLGCDGIRPECTQCLLGRRACTGYPDAWTFVPPNTSISPAVRSQPKPARPRGIAQRPGTRLPDGRPIEFREQGVDVLTSNSDLKEPGGIDISNHISRIIQCYMPEEEQHRAYNGLADSQPRICGSWVEVIHEINKTRPPDAVMGTAVRAFALAVTQNSPSVRTARLDASHAYSQAIRSLRGNLHLSAGRFREDLAVAIMCLSLAELMFPEHPSGITSHIKGVGGLFQAKGPAAFQCGIPHKLFAGSLPLLIIDGFRSREPTFLAAAEWQYEPFALSPPSPMQKLLGEAAIIPSLLHKVDNQYKASSERNISVAEELISSFIDAFSRLQRFEDMLINQGHRPFPQPPAVGCQPQPERFLWFPDITTANVLTHTWTFKVVCMTELRNLARYVPLRTVEHQEPSLRIHLNQLDDQICELSILTCQSMEFCLQDSMALYGPASTLYPLQVAYQSLKASPEHKSTLSYIESVVERLVAKGLRAVPDIVFRT